jgi:DNA gyrase/topoisomerase IV subunit A
MQDILNVLIYQNTKHKIEEEKSKWYKRSRFLRAHVCSYKSSIYDVLYPKGKCFWMRVYEIPEGSKTAKGRAIQNPLMKVMIR